MSNTAVLESLEAKWKQDPQSRVFFRFADELRKAQQYDRAIDICLAGLEHHPQYLPALICLGRCYEHTQAYTEASELYRRVLAHDPDNQHALNGMSIALEDQGDYQGALRFAESLALIQPSEELDERIAFLRKLVDEAERAASQDTVETHERALSSDQLEQEIEARESKALNEWSDLESTETSPANVDETGPSFNTLPTVQLESPLEVEPTSVEDSLTELGEEDSYEVSQEESTNEVAHLIQDIDPELHATDESLDTEVETNSSVIESRDVSSNQVGVSLDSLDAKFEQSLSDQTSPTPLGDFDSLDDAESRDDLTAAQVDEEITRALKHEKVEHYEEAISIYRDLLERASDLTQIQRNLDRVKDMLNNETVKSRKIRSLNIWLEKIKGVYHVS